MERFKGENRTYGIPLLLHTWETIKRLDHDGKEIDLKTLVETLKKRRINVPENEVGNLQKRLRRVLKSLIRAGVVKKRKAFATASTIKYIYEIKRELNEGKES